MILVTKINALVARNVAGRYVGFIISSIVTVCRVDKTDINMPARHRQFNICTRESEEDIIAHLGVRVSNQGKGLFYASMQIGRELGALLLWKSMVVLVLLLRG